MSSEPPESESHPSGLNRAPSSLGRIGPYELKGELGRGAFGAVFRAEDPAGRDVAVKLLHGTCADVTALERFFREAQVTASLSHPGILRVHAAGGSERGPWIAYELIGGTTLEGVLAEGRDRRELVGLVLQVARALGAAHRASVVHRDLKPANVLVDESGQPRVADFGLAYAVKLERLTVTGEVLGTPSYMAPEQLTGERESYGPPTDVYALGVILYQALTGELPYKAASLLQLIGQVTLGSPPRPRSLDPTIDPGLEAVCWKALSSQPAERYPNGDALADDLERYLRGEAVQAKLPRRPLPWRWLLGLSGAAALSLATALALIESPSGPLPPADDLAKVHPSDATPDSPLPPPPPVQDPRPPKATQDEPTPEELVGYAPDESELLQAQRERARQGDPRALWLLARDHEQGNNGRRKDLVRARLLTERAAKLGEAAAQVHLGKQLAAAGRHTEAVVWWRRAAERSHGEALYQLGRAYRDGYGVEQDRDEAVALFRRARGERDAMQDLAEELFRQDDSSQEALNLLISLFGDKRPQPALDRVKALFALGRRAEAMDLLQALRGNARTNADAARLDELEARHAGN